VTAGHVTLGLAVFVALGVAAAGPSVAQDASSYPAKPIRVIAPYNPGGQSDTLVRAIGQKLTEKWGQPLVIENRPGAGGNIGAEYVARAAPDGYTLLVAEGAVFTVNPSVYKNLTWDPIKDFTPVTRLNFYASVLAVHPSVPANSVAEFIALARATPRTLNYGTPGLGSGGHVNMEAFKLAQGIDLVPIHYKGSAPMQLDLTAGRLHAAFVSVFSSAPMVKAGRWKVLGYAYEMRSPILPEVPTFAEQGIPDFEVSSWFCMMGPAGMPHSITTRIQQEVARIIKDPAFAAQWFTSRGLEPVGDTPEQLAALIKAELPKWAKVIRAAGITLD
jgi:tripartite-type tricarboxylate transporter receptor subunit TctC